MKSILVLAIACVLFAASNAHARGRLLGGGGCSSGGCSSGGCSTGGGGCNISGSSGGCNISGTTRQRASVSELRQSAPATEVATPPFIDNTPPQAPPAPKLEASTRKAKPSRVLTATAEQAAFAFGAPVELAPMKADFRMVAEK